MVWGANTRAPCETHAREHTMMADTRTPPPPLTPPSPLPPLQGADPNTPVEATPEYVEKLAAEIAAGTKTQEEAEQVDGVTALHIAAAAGHKDVVQVLLDSGRLAAEQRARVARTLMRRLENINFVRDHW